jgi:hypothetical protein
MDELQEITGRAFQALSPGDSVERRSDIDRRDLQQCGAAIRGLALDPREGDSSVDLLMSGPLEARRYRDRERARIRTEGRSGKAG